MPNEEEILNNIRINKLIGKTPEEQNKNEILQEKIRQFVISCYEEILNEYDQNLSSHNGKYICSDLFKRIIFSMLICDGIINEEDNDQNYSRYVSVIHNSSAVLAEMQFRRQVANTDNDNCILLTGVPGAGKTFLIESLYTPKLFDKSLDNTIVYEGDVTTLTIMDKINLLEKAGIKTSIVVVNPTPELAFLNAAIRSKEQGRGASTTTQARIMGKMPKALNQILMQYPDISASIYTKYDNYTILMTTELYYKNLQNQEYNETIDWGTQEELQELFENIRTKYYEIIQNDPAIDLNDLLNELRQVREQYYNKKKNSHHQ